jgi:uncharacterized membrane protein SpoIIM required for sporulation
VAAERPYWRELEAQLELWERDPDSPRSLAELERFHYLYERATSGLARLASFAAPPEVGRFLEGLVSRAYAEIHGHHRAALHSPLRFLAETLPRAVRRRARALALAAAVTAAGAAFGAGAVAFDEQAKGALLPFAHLLGDPSERVRLEESAAHDPVAGRGASFSSTLFSHNSRVAIFSLALGMSWGVGTLALLFYNGVVLGAVVLDYLRAGEGLFLAGWLLPHGAVEIPAFLIAGQAGLVLAGALVGHGSRAPVAARLRSVGPDLVVLATGFGALLAWAALVESFFSQYHEPAVPYWAKVAFGVGELALLGLWLARSGRGRAESA